MSLILDCKTLSDSQALIRADSLEVIYPVQFI